MARQQKSLDFAFRFFERLSGDLWVVPGAEPSGRACPNQESFVPRHVGQGELVRVYEPRADRASDAFRVLRVAFLRHEQVAAKQRLQRAKNVSAAAAQAH